VRHDFVVGIMMFDGFQVAMRRWHENDWGYRTDCVERSDHLTRHWSDGVMMKMGSKTFQILDRSNLADVNAALVELVLEKRG
jgi:hypothetical protein